QRPYVALWNPDTVGNFVADVYELVRGEDARQLGGRDVADLDPAVLDHIRVRDFARRAADRDANIIIAQQMFELVDEIVAEEGRAGDARRIGAGLVEPGERAPDSRTGELRLIVDPELRI